MGQKQITKLHKNGTQEWLTQQPQTAQQNRKQNPHNSRKNQRQQTPITAEKPEAAGHSSHSWSLKINAHKSPLGSKPIRRKNMPGFLTT